MSKCARRFDPYLMNILANELKRMAGLWVKAGKLCKAECAEAICEGLADPERVPAALAKLKPPQRTALALHQGGGRRTWRRIAWKRRWSRPATCLRGQHRYSRRSYPWCEDLIHRGVALAAGSYGPTSLDSYSSGEERIFTDERLLEHAPEPEIAVIEIEADLSAEAGLQRPPGSVVLDILGVVQAVEKAGGVGFTQAGLPRVSDMKKLRRELRWTDSMKVDGLPFPNLTEAVVTALRAAGLLERIAIGSAACRTAGAVRRASSRRAGATARARLRQRERVDRVGLVRRRTGTHWRHGGYPRMRHALLTALRALPPKQSGFFAMDRFDEALFERIGEHVSLDSHAPSPPYTYGVSGDELQSKMEEWRRDLRSRWLEQERPWIERAFTTWLYWLGVVELSIAGRRRAGFPVDGTRAGGTPRRDTCAAVPEAEDRFTRGVGRPTRFRAHGLHRQGVPDATGFCRAHCRTARTGPATRRPLCADPGFDIPRSGKRLHRE